MGYTSIIEIDHDQLHEIEDDPIGFVRELREDIQGNRITPNCSGRGWKLIALFPRYPESSDVYNAWERWKRKWGRPRE